MNEKYWLKTHVVHKFSSLIQWSVFMIFYIYINRLTVTINVHCMETICKKTVRKIFVCNLQHMGLKLHERKINGTFCFWVNYAFKTEVYLNLIDYTKAFAAQLTMISSSATRVQRPRLVAHWNTKSRSTDCYNLKFAGFLSCKGAIEEQRFTACLAWMLADPSLRMVLNTGLRVLKTSSLSIPEPSWMHRRHASEAAAHCSTPLPGLHMQTASSTFCTDVMGTSEENISNYSKSQIKPTFLQAALNAVCDGHPSLGNELVEDFSCHGSL